MRTIWKFPLYLTDEQIVSMPSGAEILTVQLQGNVLTVWAVVNSEKSLEEKAFYIRGTGHAFEDWLSTKHYIGTVQLVGLVWHVFTRP